MNARTYTRTCRNPKCKEEFTTTHHNQLYCSPECRLSKEKNYKMSRVDKPYTPPLPAETRDMCYVCEKCGSKMELKFSDKGHKLYLYCTKPYCNVVVDYDRFLNEGYGQTKVRRDYVKR